MEQLCVMVLMRDHSSFVAECLRSIHRELGPHVRVLAVDVGSKDESAEIASSLGDALFDSFTLHRLTRETPTARTLQFLAANVKSTWASLISADDALGLGYGTFVQRTINSDLPPACYSFTQIRTTEDGVPIDIRRPKWTGVAAVDRRGLLSGNPGMAPGMLLPWSSIVDQPYWRHTPPITLEDYWLWWMVVGHLPLRSAESGYVLYRQHPNNQSRDSMSQLRAYSLGYAVALARGHAHTLGEQLLTMILLLRHLRHVPWQRLAAFLQGLQTNWVASKDLPQQPL